MMFRDPSIKIKLLSLHRSNRSSILLKVQSLEVLLMEKALVIPSWWLESVIPDTYIIAVEITHSFVPPSSAYQRGFL